MSRGPFGRKLVGPEEGITFSEPAVATRVHVDEFPHQATEVFASRVLWVIREVPHGLAQIQDVVKIYRFSTMLFEIVQVGDIGCCHNRT